MTETYELSDKIPRNEQSSKMIQFEVDRNWSNTAHQWQFFHNLLEPKYLSTFAVQIFPHSTAIHFFCNLVAYIYVIRFFSERVIFHF